MSMTTARHRQLDIDSSLSTARYRQLVIDSTSSTARHRQLVIDRLSSTARHRQLIIDSSSSTVRHRQLVIDSSLSTARHRQLVINSSSSTDRVWQLVIDNSSSKAHRHRWRAVDDELTNDLYIAGYILCVNKRSLETVYYHCRVVFGVNQDSWFFFIFLLSYFMPLKKAWYTSHVKPILQFFFRNWHRYFQIACKSL